MNLDQQPLPRLTGFRLAFIRSLAALLGFILTPLGADRAQAAINIMPLGDSITQGGKAPGSTGLTVYASYRYALYFKLKAAGYIVNMVGSHDTLYLNLIPTTGDYPNYSTTFDRHNEGHWGKTTAFIDQNINTWLAGLSTADKPDWVILNIGTNDANNISTATYAAQLNSVINKLRASNPNITIVLSNIMVFINHEASCAEFNAAITNIVATRNTPASRIVLADINTNLPANARYDGIHPNFVGEEHLASVYFNAIQSVIAAAPVTVDNAPSARVSLFGSWNASTATPGYHGADYLHDNNTAKGTKAVTFLPPLPADGDYLVYARWTAAPNRATNVPIDVVAAAGTSTVMVNQQLNGAAWNLLGYYHFSAATAAVTIRTTDTDGFVIADAISLVPAPGLTVDNTDSAVTAVGAWSASTGTPGYLGTNYFHDGNTDKGTKSFSFKPAVPETDNYWVYARWPAGTDRATNVPVDIVSSSGAVTTLTVNQQTNSNKWTFLGTHSLAAENAEVKFRTTGTNGFVIADGVRVITVPVGEYSSPIELLRAKYFTPAELNDPAISGDLADPDQDGVKNIFEYGLGDDPLYPDAAMLPRVDMTEERLTLSFHYDASLCDLIYTVQATSTPETPASWIDIAFGTNGAALSPLVPGTSLSETSGAGTFKDVEVRDAVTSGESARRFLRLKLIR